jgi:peptide/nickel transport system substrate-binding protein
MTRRFAPPITHGVILRIIALVVGLALTTAPAMVAQSPASEQPGQSPASEQPAQSPGGGPPGPAAERLLFNSFFVDRAPLELEAGNMDLYLYSLRTEAAQELQGNENIRLINAPATTLSLILNPAPAPEGRLNPFSIPEVRQAMQYLVNRDFIAQDIYGGLAQPMVTHVGPSDFDFLTVYDIDRGSGIRYDPELGRQMITDAMTGAGAELVNGRWQFQGQPIRLTFIARTEDERRQIGELVRAELDQAGFDVSMSLQQFAPATLSVYSTDPQAFEWHIYTEGWGRGAAQRYDDGTVNSMNAPWLGNMPGWREVGFWQYEDAEMDEMGQRLFRGEFDSLEERNEIYRTMTQRGLDASVRVWLVNVMNSFPTTTAVEDLTTDVVAGPRTPYSLREASVPGSEDVTVGHLWVWTDRTTWNPIGGFGDVYSVDIWRNLFDPAIWNHPFTGETEPFRATYELETAGPEGTLEVPSDAVLWDAASDEWRPVDAGSTAVSKVTFDYSKYLQSRWHDGQPISLADAVYSIAQGFDIAYDEDKVRIETAIAATSRPYLETFKGFRILDDDRLEVYVDYWHFDEGSIAAYASPSSFSMPWEILAAMDDLVFEQRRAAYSDTAAARYSVPWLSLVMSRDARLVERTLREFEREERIPEGVFEMGDRSLVSPEEAAGRYEAAQAWFDEYGHLVISNGPFYLARYDPSAQYAELRAYRDDTYPFHAGDWAFGDPPVLAISPPEVEPIGIGQDATVEVTVEGPGTIGLRYLLIDPAAGTVVTSGEAEPGSTPGTFSVPLTADVTGTLFPGPYRLSLAAWSDAVALVSERQVDLEVTP